MRILLVDDERRVLRFLDRLLRAEGYECDLVQNGHEALTAAAEHSYGAIVLDVRLPDIDGFEVSRRLRDEGCWAPILMLTGKHELDARVMGLDAGADDYLCKPFENAELLARLRALTRRSVAPRPPVLLVDDLRLDPAEHTVARGERPIELTTKEFALLEFLMRRAGTVVSRAELLDAIWGYRYGSKVVDVYVSYLRNKIDRPFGLTSIRSVRGIGYELVTQQAEGATA
jgi:two-component system, OmpR family, response regulator